MASLKDTAQAFKPKQTKNIADLDIVDINTEIYHDGKGVDKEGNEFRYSYIKNGEDEYRIPSIVLGMIKDYLEENPKLSKFKVKKTGEGLKSRYTLIPIM